MRSPFAYSIHRTILPIAGAMLLQLGCADDAQVGDDRQDTASASGTATGGGATGTGGTTSGSTSSSSSTSSTGGAGGMGGSGDGGAGAVGGAGGGCPGAVFTVSGDGPTKQFDFACKNSHGAAETTEANAYIGYEKPISVDPTQDEQMWVEGCATPNQPPMAGSLSLEAPQVVVGTTMTGKAMYYDGIDAYATETDVTLTVTQIDAITVKGSYTATVQTVNNSVKMLSGNFAVCRVADFLPP